MSHYSFKWVAILTLTFFPIKNGHGTRPLWIAWNTGQGSFATLQQEARCDHFDTGGEFLPRNFAKLCPQMKQTASITHADSDHWQLLPKTRKFICLNWPVPVPPDISRKKNAALRKLVRCKSSPLHAIESWLALNSSPTAGTNDIGRWFQIWQQVLVTGDSPKSIERQMKDRVSREVRVLMLGHHGSRTSTSSELLDRLAGLKIAISSARKAKYGHPHIETIWLLKNKGVSLLRTEDWGTIGLELAPSVHIHPQKNAGPNQIESR